MTGKRRVLVIAAAAFALLWGLAPQAAAQGANPGAGGEAWPAWADALIEASPELEQLVADCEQLLADNDPEWATRGCESVAEHWAGSKAVTETWFSTTDSTSAQTTFGLPITNYSIYWDGGSWTSFHRKFLGQAISGAWAAGIIALRFSAWAYDWVAEGRLSEVITAIPRLIADTLDTTLVRGLRLREAALTALAVATGWSVIRGRHAEAAGNAAFALIAMGLAGLLLSNFDGYYTGAQHTKQELVEAVLVGSHSANPNSADTVALTSPLMDTVVHRPWMRLNFGRELQGDCEIGAGARTLHRAAGPGDHYPRLQIKECDPDGPVLDAFNRVPTVARLAGGMAVLVGHLAIAFLVLSTAMLALSSELLLAGAFGTLPVVAAAVAFPGGRRVAEKWVTTLLKGIAGLAAGVLFLRITVEILNAVSAASSHLGMFDMFAVLVLVAVAAIKLRKALPEAASKLSGSIGARLSSAGSGGGGGGAMAAGAGGAAAGLLAGGYLSSQLLGGHTPARYARHAAAKAHTVGAKAAKAGATGVAAYNGEAGGGKLASMARNTRAGGGGGLAAAGVTGAISALGNKAHSRQGAQHALAMRDPKKMSDSERTAVADRMDTAAQSSRRSGQLMAADSQLTRQDSLDHLMQSRRKGVREAIAARPDNTQTRADSLAMDRSGRVRSSAVASGATSIDAALAQRRTGGATRRAANRLAADPPPTEGHRQPEPDANRRADRQPQADRQPETDRRPEPDASRRADRQPQADRQPETDRRPEPDASRRADRQPRTDERPSGGSNGDQDAGSGASVDRGEGR